MEALLWWGDIINILLNSNFVMFYSKKEWLRKILSWFIDPQVDLLCTSLLCTSHKLAKWLRLWWFIKKEVVNWFFYCFLLVHKEKNLFSTDRSCVPMMKRSIGDYHYLQIDLFLPFSQKVSTCLLGRIFSNFCQVTCKFLLIFKLLKLLMTKES